jgi:hypothetical protein
LKFVYCLCWWLQSDDAVSAHVNREVLTGEIPYAGFTPLQAAIGVVQRGLRPEIPPFVPEKLSLLAQQCWHQDPKQRPEFSEVVAVLEEMVMVRTPNRRFMFGGRKTRGTLLLA